MLGVSRGDSQPAAPSPASDISRRESLHAALSAAAQAAGTSAGPHSRSLITERGKSKSPSLRLWRLFPRCIRASTEEVCVAAEASLGAAPSECTVTAFKAGYSLPVRLEFLGDRLAAGLLRGVGPVGQPGDHDDQSLVRSTRFSRSHGSTGQGAAATSNAFSAAAAWSRRTGEVLGALRPQQPDSELVLIWLTPGLSPGLVMIELHAPARSQCGPGSFGPTEPSSTGLTTGNATSVSSIPSNLSQASLSQYPQFQRHSSPQQPQAHPPHHTTHSSPIDLLREHLSSYPTEAGHVHGSATPPASLAVRHDEGRQHIHVPQQQGQQQELRTRATSAPLGALDRCALGTEHANPVRPPWSTDPYPGEQRRHQPQSGGSAGGGGGGSGSGLRSSGMLTVVVVPDGEIEAEVCGLLARQHQQTPVPLTSGQGQGEEDGASGAAGGVLGAGGQGARGGVRDLEELEDDDDARARERFLYDLGAWFDMSCTFQQQQQQAHPDGVTREAQGGGGGGGSGGSSRVSPDVPGGTNLSAEAWTPTHWSAMSAADLPLRSLGPNGHVYGTGMEGGGAGAGAGAGRGGQPEEQLPAAAVELLGFACSRGWAATSSHIVTGLMDMGFRMARINAAVQSAHGWSALHLAAASGSAALLASTALWRAYERSEGERGAEELRAAWKDMLARPGPGGLTPLHLAAVLPYPADAAMDLLSALPAETLPSWFAAAACDDCTPAHYAARGGNAHLNDHALMCLAMGAERLEGAADAAATAAAVAGGGAGAVEEAGAYNGMQLRSLDLGQLPMDSGEVGRMAGGSTASSVPLESSLEGHVAAAEAAGGRLRAAVGALAGSGRTAAAADMRAELNRVLAVRHGGGSTEGLSEEGHSGVGVGGRSDSGGRGCCMLDDDCGGGGGFEWGSSEAAGFHLQPRWGFGGGGGGGGSLGAGASRVAIGDSHSGSFAVSRTLGRNTSVRAGAAAAAAAAAASPDGTSISVRPAADTTHTRRPRLLQSLTPQVQAQLSQQLAQGQAYQHRQHSAQHLQGLSAASAAAGGGGGAAPPPMPPPLLPGAEQWLPESWQQGHVTGGAVRSSSWLNPQSLVAGLLDRVSPSPSGSHAGSLSASPMMQPGLWLPQGSDANATLGFARGQLRPSLMVQGLQQQQQEGGSPDPLPSQQQQQQQQHDAQAAVLRTAIRSAVAAAEVDADAPTSAQEGELSGGGGRRRAGRDQQWAFTGPVAPSTLQEWVASAAVAGAALQQPPDTLPTAVLSDSAGREAAADGLGAMLVSPLPLSQQQQQHQRRPQSLMPLSPTASVMSFSSVHSGGERLSQRLVLAAERMTRGSGPASHGSVSGPDGTEGPPSVQQVQLELRQLVPLQSTGGQQQQQHIRRVSTGGQQVQRQQQNRVVVSTAPTGVQISTGGSGGTSDVALAPMAASTPAPVPFWGAKEHVGRSIGQAEPGAAADAGGVVAAGPASSQLGVLASGLALVAAVGTCLYTAPQAVVAVVVAVVSALLLQRLLLQHQRQAAQQQQEQPVGSAQRRE